MNLLFLLIKRVYDLRATNEKLQKIQLSWSLVRTLAAKEQ